MEELKIGDKVYVVGRDDSEIECYVYKKMDDGMYEVKLREGKSFGFYKREKITKIDPPYWESLEENLENCGLSTDEIKENLSCAEGMIEKSVEGLKSDYPDASLDGIHFKLS